MSLYVLTIVDCHLRDMFSELISMITNLILNYMNVKTVVIVPCLTYVEKMHIKLQKNYEKQCVGILQIYDIKLAFKS